MSSPERTQDEPPTPLPPNQPPSTPSSTHQSPAVASSLAQQSVSIGQQTPSSTLQNDSTNVIPNSPNQIQEWSPTSPRQCWICFGTEDDDDSLAFIQPCNCRGTTKWVHHKCLLQWVDEKQDGNVRKIIACPQCKTEYLLFFPQSHTLGQMAEQLDRMIYRVCPFITGCFIAGSVYWMAVSYGAITVATIIGEQEAVQTLAQYDPSVILTALPAIPTGLIILSSLQWEDACLKVLRKVSPHLPILNYFLPGPLINYTGAPQEIELNERTTCTRIFTGAFLLPAIAKLCGDTFFAGIESPLYRSLAGGAAFIAAKGCFTMFHKQQLYKKLSRRRILDYTEENIREMRRTRYGFVQTLVNDST